MVPLRQHAPLNPGGGHSPQACGQALRNAYESDKKQELEETVLLGTLEEEQSKIEIIYKEPPTELKLQVGEQLLNHK